MSSLRILLVDPLGEVLFSGESLSARANEVVATPSRDAAEPANGEGEMCPETMRSAGSGVYRAAAATMQSTDGERDKEAPTQRRGVRAA